MRPLAVLSVLTALLAPLALATSAGGAASIEARILAPAVAPEEPSGAVATHLSVEVVPGEGRIFFQSPPLTSPDFEQAVRDAIEAAASFTNKDISEFDFLVGLDAGPDAIVEGPSIGAAAGVAAAAALTDRQVRKDVAITGTLDRNGTVGEVGGVLKKLAGAESGGARIFLVPEPDTRVRLVNETRIQLGRTEIVVETKGETVNVIDVGLEKFGLRVAPVRTLAQAYEVATSEASKFPTLPGPEGATPADEALPSEPGARRVIIPGPWAAITFLGVAGAAMGSRVRRSAS